MRADRLFSSRRDPLDATGARRSGGRWNSPGTSMLYAASSLSLACLEILVHLRNPGQLPQLSFVEFEIAEADIRPWTSLLEYSESRTRSVLDSEVLSREIGDEWISARRGRRTPAQATTARPVFQVPSAVIHQEWNYLIDPEAAGLIYSSPQQFRLDQRLIDPLLR